MTPRYIANRLAVALVRRRHPDDPWLPRAATQFLARWLRPTDVGFEWGSGRSTAWFARRVRHLTSVEEFPEWQQKVKTMLAEQSLTNVDYRSGKREGGPESTFVRAIDGIAPESLDFALVDGMWRHLCAQEAVPRLRPGGLLIVDDIEWFLPLETDVVVATRLKEGPDPNWRELAPLVLSWRHHIAYDGVSATGFFMKPVDARSAADSSQDP